MCFPRLKSFLDNVMPPFEFGETSDKIVGVKENESKVMFRVVVSGRFRTI